MKLRVKYTVGPVVEKFEPLLNQAIEDGLLDDKQASQILKEQIAETGVLEEIWTE